MKTKIIIVAIITLCFANAYSQKGGFAKGYYIDNHKNKVECFIKDEDWDYNPVQFICKTTENSESKIIKMADFQEFSVDEYKFIKEEVKIDKSEDNKIEDMSGIKALNLEQDTLLLRILVQGEATLYSYKNANFTRFFYNQNNSINQLSFKMYREDGGVRENMTYKQELLNTFKCDKISQNDIEDLKYDNDNLSAFFVKYNRCKGSVLNNEFKAPKNIKTFELYVKAGVASTSLTFNDGTYSADFGSKTKFKPAVELEVNLSNKAKNFSLLAEVAYQYYKGTGNLHNGTEDVTLDYKAIDVSFGLRKYFYLSSKSLLFINGYGTYALPTNSEIGSYLQTSKTFTASLGVGYLYNKRYSLEIRYEFSRDLLASYAVLSAKSKTIGVNFGYKFL